jgi:hypothetical protein
MRTSSVLVLMYSKEEEEEIDADDDQELSIECIADKIILKEVAM